MPTFGRYGRWPRRFGGAASVQEQHQEALLKANEDFLDPADDKQFFQETYAEARVLSIMWSANRRLENQSVPERMLENLPVWEQSLTLRPTLDDTDVARRALVSARLRGLHGNTPGDVEEAVRRIWGENFISITTPDTADQITYWPGINPGPPGFEWSTNRVRICIRVNNVAVTHSQFIANLHATVDLLQGMLAAWESFVIGTGDSFICNVGIVGQTFL